MLKKKIAVIGAGKMGSAIIKGLIFRRAVSPGNIIACDRDNARLRPFARKGVKTTTCNIEAVKRGEVIIFSVKPGDMGEVLREIASARHTSPLAGQAGPATALKGRLFISIAAGITTSSIEEKLGKVPVIRAMPNTPALAAEAMSAISPGRYARPGDENIARTIFKSIGCVMKFPEKHMDAVTALSGSGPAYFFFLMEALIAAGKRLGISAADSLNLTLQTALGSAVLAKKSDIAPDKLIEMVTSKGGTTEAAFKILTQQRVRDTIIKAVLAAAKRSKKMGTVP